MNKKLIILLFTGLASNALAFDLEDYATTYRATRDAHVKAQKEWAEASNEMNQLKNYLKANCLQVEDSSGFEYKNLNGLTSGTCNRDDQAAHVTGGVLPLNGKLKFGDKVARIFELQPAFRQYGITSLISSSATAFSFPEGDLEVFGTTYREARDQFMNDHWQLININSRVTKIPGCQTDKSTVQDLVDAKVSIAILASPTLNPIVVTRTTENLIYEDFNTKYKELREALYMKTKELLLSTAPHLAAREAYKSSVAVYVNSLNCNPEYGINANDRLLYDPYLPEVSPY